MATLPATTSLRTESTSRRAAGQTSTSAAFKVPGPGQRTNPCVRRCTAAHYRSDGGSAVAREHGGLRLCCRARRRLPVLDVKSLEQRPPAKSRVLTHHSHNHPKQIPSRSNRLRVGLARRQRSQTTCATSSAAPSQVLNGASSWPQTKN